MRSSPKKGTTESCLPQQPPLLCQGLVGPFSLTKSAFHISPCLTHLLLLQINHPLVLLGKHGPRSQTSLSPQGTPMSICSSFFFYFSHFFLPSPPFRRLFSNRSPSHLAQRFLL